MTSQNFARSLKHVLVSEGGKVDDKHDPGGRTNQGVIQRVYDGWRDRKGLARRDVWLMEPAERDAIYRAQYWDAVRGDDLPAGVDYVVFDGAVNSGPGQSVKWLQRALGTVKVDGQIGMATLAAVAAHPDHDALVADICARRLAFLKALSTWPRFGKGWAARVGLVEETGQAWASGSVGPAPAHTGGDAKATIQQARLMSSPAGGDVATGGGIASLGVGAVLKQAQDALQPLADGSPVITHVVAALVISGAVVTLGGIAWGLWSRRKAKAQADALDLAVPA